jgi:hypothetical protein
MAGYGTDDDFIAWLTAQGLSLPDDAPAPAVLRQIGSSYVDAAYEYRLGCSERTGGFEQELAWPRKGHYFNGKPVPDDLIPQAWVHAAYRAAYLQAIQPGWATGSRDGNRVTKREKVDTIEREFFDADQAPGSDAAPGMVSDSIINSLVLPWLCPTGRSLNSLFRVV